MKNKLNNKHGDPPSALIDEEGNVLTSHDEIKNENSKHYENVLKNKPIKEHLKGYQKDRERLALLRLKQTGSNKTPNWTLKNLEDVLVGLKKNKSRDSHGLSNEIFRPEVIGSDLK